MKEAFKNKNISADRLAIIKIANGIITRYTQQGYSLTLRQLYYQFISGDLFPASWQDPTTGSINNERSYKNLGKIISDGRLNGLIDWEAIEDRGRRPMIWADYQNAEDFLATELRTYRRPRWDGQENYVELWVEKEALAGVLSPLASEFHIVLMVNKGYSSQSAMFESAQRFINKKGDHEYCHLLYLGDMDPSGQDMVRDVADRLTMFGAEVEKIALTPEQVKQYKPPKNPAKMSDSRAIKYVAEFGRSSWEVDALPPEVLSKIIRKSVAALLDVDQMNEIKALEKRDIEALLKVAKKLRD